MHRANSEQSGKRVWLRRMIASAVVATLLVSLLSFTVFAQNRYVITDGDLVTAHNSFSRDPETVLKEVGIKLGEEDTYTTTYTDGVGKIDVQRMQRITVIHHGVSRTVSSYGETVAELLSRMNIVPGANDVLSCQTDRRTFNGMTVSIVQKEIRLEEYDEVISYQTNYFEDPELDPDEEIVLVEGADGSKHCQAQIVLEDGEEVSRKVLTETVTQEAVTRLVVTGVKRTILSQVGGHGAIGTTGGTAVKPSDSSPSKPSDGGNSKPSNDNNGSVTPSDGNNGGSGSTTTPSDNGSESPSAPQEPSDPDRSEIGENTITTSNGTTYTYSQKLTVKATAYSCEGYTGYTYSGTVARVGAIAVDPNYIPLGTKMYIVSNDGQYVYGYCVAEDTGSAIKGYKVDLYFNTIAECYAFGVRTCTLYILN